MNEKIRIEIEDLTNKGDGLGRYNGKVVFVPGAFPGDFICAELLEDKGSFYRGRLLKIIEPSKDRVESDCPYSKACGGCQLRDISYEAQLRWKAKYVKDCISRIAGIENPCIREIIPSKTAGYRNKVEFYIEGTRLGFREEKSHKFVPVEKCLLADEMICERKASLENELEEKAAQGEKQKFVKATIRSSASGEVMTILESKTGFVQSDWRVIHDEIKTDMSVLKTEVSPLSFYQVNPTQCSKLYSKVQDYADLKGGEKILDLYCGAGSIGLSMANKAGRVIGVESVKPAVIDANRNAVINGIVNAEFICGKAEEAVPTKLQGVKADVVILDPPRSGCKESLLDTVASVGAEKIIYVSCNPSTLARDLKILCSKGYEFVEATPVDMFANTVHCEVICLMSKG